MRTAGGEVFKILVPPLFEYITVIVDNEGCTPDEYECLNTQVGMQTSGGEVFKLVNPLFQYITVILDKEGCTPDEYECLNTQVSMWTAGVKCLNW